MAKKLSRAMKASVDLRMMGPEPEVITVTDPKDPRLVKALRWYGYFYDIEDGKQWMLSYAKNNMDKTVLKGLREAPAWRISMTAATLAHLLERGFDLPESSHDFIDSRINQAIRPLAANDDVREETTVVRMNPHLRTQRKVNNQLAEIEGLVDEHLDGRTDFNFYTWATANGATPALAAKAKEYYESLLKEMNEHPEDFRDSYAKKSKALFASIVTDADRLTNNKKVVRKPRKAALPSTEKQVKGLKFKEKDIEHKLVSINPTDIIGAKQLWVFYPKYKALGVFVAKTDMGLRVHGSSITEFDETKSGTKKLRDPAKTLDALISCRKPYGIFEGLSTKAQAISPRINDSIVLVRAVK